MSRLTQLFVFPQFYTATRQNEELAQLVHDPKVRATFGTVDLTVVNQDEEEDRFAPLKIEKVRELQLEVSYPPVQHDVRVIIIGNLELASLPAQQALLKLLEEPPEYAQVIVTTFDPSALLPTILSRCQLIRADQEKDSSRKDELPAELLTALAAFPKKSLNLKTVFGLSDQYKERADAITLVTSLLESLHETDEYPTSDQVKFIKKCLDTLEFLKKNINARLAVEELLFELVEKKQ